MIIRVSCQTAEKLEKARADLRTGEITTKEFNELMRQYFEHEEKMRHKAV